MSRVCRRPESTRTWLGVLLTQGLFLSVAAIVAGPLQAAGGATRLLMVEERGCRFCVKWDSDVGRAYEKSDVGRFAPLVRVKRDSPELAGLTPAPFTPTFILQKNGREIGRITGYPGPAFFWEELEGLARQAGFRSGAQTRG